MKWRVVCIAVLTIVLAFGLVGCNALSGDDTPTTAPTASQAGGDDSTSATATPQPADEATALPETEEESPTAADDSSEPLSEITPMEQFDTYHLVHKMSWTWEQEDGTQQQNDMNIEVWFVRDPLAQHMVMSGKDENGEDVAVETIQIGNTSYMNFGGEWIAMTSSTGAADISEIGWFSDPDSIVSGDAKKVGRETVNGFQTDHYRYDEKALQAASTGFTSITAGQVDYWIAEDEGLVVRMVAEWTGTDEDGKEGTFSMESDLLSVNEPITIEPPEGVEQPGLPDDIPAMDGATDMQAMSGIVAFSVSATPEEVIAFYQQAMVDNGWGAGEDMGGTMLSFSKDTRTATIITSEREDGTGTDVTIMVGENQ